MKKLCALFLALVMLCSLFAGCGKTAEAADKPAPAEQAEAPNAPAAADAAEPSEEPASDEPSGESSGKSSTFTYTPYWDESNLKTAVGGEILFFGDIHDYEDDYFYYDAETGETRGVFSYLKNYDKHPGMYVSIGDYLQSSHDITDPAGVYFKCIDRIRAYAGDDAPIISVMGNHENDTAAADGLTGEQVFEKTVGNNNYGLVAQGVDEAGQPLYYVVAFGAAHTQEYDAAGTRATASNKYWVNPDEIAALDETLAAIYGEDGSQNAGIPTFIDAHIPIHYFTAERSAENNCDLLDVLNKYPYVVYVWGHDHSEKDPYYGTVKLPGNTLVPNATLDALDAGGDAAAEEINFTYVACGCVRGNQISDSELEDSERALYVTVDGSKVSFEYCGRDGEIFDRTKLASPLDTTYYEQFTTLGAASAAGLTVDLAAATDSSTVQCGDFFLDRPVIGASAEPAVSFSDRYTTETRWLDASGEEVTAFEAGESYTAELTLTAAEGVTLALDAEDVFLFDSSAVLIPGRYVESKTVATSDTEATVSVTFTALPAMAAAPLEPVQAVEENKPYAIASANELYLSSCTTADCVREGDRLLSELSADKATWSFVPCEGGWLLKNANGTYMTLGVNGPHIVLTPVAALTGAECCVWSVADGALSIAYNGTPYYLKYTAGAFALAAGADDSVCRLYAAE